MHSLVPKHLGISRSRKPKFELTLKIIELNNVPLVSGTSSIKWHLPHSVAAEHRGRTSKCHIKDHKVSYDHEIKAPVRLTVDKNGNLQETNIQFEVVQEYSSGGRVERIVLGTLKLNLAEYTETAEYDGEEGVVRRYLMQDSKINSTLKIGIKMDLIEGERNFVAPALRSAPVFGGIAGIIAGEQGDTDDPGQMPSLNSKTLESGQMQDMYRRSLTAYWTAQPGDLKADECIEDIFAGGDGWGDKNRFEHATPQRRGGRQRDQRNLDADRHTRTRREHSGDGLVRTRTRDEQRRRSRSGQRSLGRERASLEQHADSIKADSGGTHDDAMHEVDEFDIRSDLRAWKTPEVTA